MIRGTEDVNLDKKQKGEQERPYNLQIYLHGRYYIWTFLELTESEMWCCWDTAVPERQV